MDNIKYEKLLNSFVTLPTISQTARGTFDFSGNIFELFFLRDVEGDWPT